MTSCIFRWNKVTYLTFCNLLQAQSWLLHTGASFIFKPPIPEAHLKFWDGSLFPFCRTMPHSLLFWVGFFFPPSCLQSSGCPCWLIYLFNWLRNKRNPHSLASSDFSLSVVEVLSNNIPLNFWFGWDNSLCIIEGQNEVLLKMTVYDAVLPSSGQMIYCRQLRVPSILLTQYFQDGFIIIIKKMWRIVLKNARIGKWGILQP